MTAGLIARRTPPLVVYWMMLEQEGIEIDEGGIEVFRFAGLSRLLQAGIGFERVS
jgi:hypothetical protein